MVHISQPPIQDTVPLQNDSAAPSLNSTPPNRNPNIDSTPIAPVALLIEKFSRPTTASNLPSSARNSKKNGITTSSTQSNKSSNINSTKPDSSAQILSMLSLELLMQIAEFGDAQTKQSLRHVNTVFKAAASYAVQHVTVTNSIELFRAIRAYRKGGIHLLKLVGQDFTAKDLRTLTPAVQGLDLSQCNLSCADLAAAASNLKHLKHLVFAGRQDIADKLPDLKNLPNLQSLDLSSIHNIPKDALAGFSELKQLRTLKLNDCQNLEPEHFEHIAQLIFLQVLEAAGIEVPKGAFADFQKLTQLRCLNLSVCTHLTQEHLEKIEQLTSLQELRLGLSLVLTREVEQKQRWAKTLEGAFAGFQKLTQLRRLYLSECSDHLTKEHCEHIAQLISLQELEIDASKIPNGAFADFTNLTQLRDLNLSGGGHLTKEHCEHIAQLISLRVLKIGSRTIPEGAFASFPNLTQLISLHLSGGGGPLSKEHCEHIAQLISLQVLKIGYRTIPEGALAGFPNLTQLLSLDLYGCLGLVPEHFKHIAQLRHLQRLYIERNNIPPESLQALQKLPNLQIISK